MSDFAAAGATLVSLCGRTQNRRAEHPSHAERYRARGCDAATSSCGGFRHSLAEYGSHVAIDERMGVTLLTAYSSSRIKKKKMLFDRLSASRALRTFRITDLEQYRTEERFVDSVSIPLRMKSFCASRASLTLPHCTMILAQSFPRLLDAVYRRANPLVVLMAERPTPWSTMVSLWTTAPLRLRGGIRSTACMRKHRIGILPRCSRGPWRSAAGRRSSIASSCSAHLVKR